MDEIFCGSRAKVNSGRLGTRKRESRSPPLSLPVAFHLRVAQPASVSRHVRLLRRAFGSYVVSESPDEVEAYPAHDGSREVERGGRAEQRRLHQHDVGRLNRNVGAAANRDAHVRLRTYATRER
eukprot:620543-Pleurochrysis_carterae.AAC.3